jgi:hypothetical protein
MLKRENETREMFGVITNLLRPADRASRSRRYQDITKCGFKREAKAVGNYIYRLLAIVCYLIILLSGFCLESQIE